MSAQGGINAVKPSAVLATSPNSDKTTLHPYGAPANINYRGLREVQAMLQKHITGKGGAAKVKTRADLESWIRKHYKGEESDRPMFSRSGQSPSGLTIAQQADAILSAKSGTPTPVDAILRGVSNVLGITKTTKAAYAKGAHLLDLMVPETVKAGVVADYGILGINNQSRP